MDPQCVGNADTFIAHYILGSCRAVNDMDEIGGRIAPLPMVRRGSHGEYTSVSISFYFLE